MLKKYLPIIMFIGAILAFTCLAILVHYHSVLSLDVTLSRYIQGEGNFGILNRVSYFGKPVVALIMVFITGVIFWVFNYYRETIFVLLTLVASGIHSVVKRIVDRPRPDDSLINVLSHEHSQSFPSGHVNFFVVFFGFVIVAMLMKPKISRPIRVLVVLISLFMIVSVSFSRIYLGTHWASDVLGGYLLGYSLLSILLYFYLKPNLNSK